MLLLPLNKLLTKVADPVCTNSQNIKVGGKYLSSLRKPDFGETAFLYSLTLVPAYQKGWEREGSPEFVRTLQLCSLPGPEPL